MNYPQYCVTFYFPRLIHNVWFTQNVGLKNSDTENFSVNVDVEDDDDMSTDDDDDVSLFLLI